MFRALFSMLTLALIILVPVSAGAVTHTINQSGLSFSPSPITIELGDTVEWVWGSGNHTVTSGTGAADPNVGSLFDSSFNSGNPLVTYTFSDTVGLYSYFCRPHEGANMKGTINVEASSVGIRSVWIEETTWGELKSLFLQ